jgi:sRNA-binding regulator protein Hfq
MMSKLRKIALAKCKNLTLRYKEDPAFRKMSWIIFAAFFLSSIAAYNLPIAAEGNAIGATVRIDEAIPANSVLIPIKVQNEASLEGVFEESGYVDLYSAPEDEKLKSERVVSGVKMIRSARQHDQFAVIVPTSDASKIVRAHGIFFVTIQSRLHHQSGSNLKTASRVLTIDRN